MKIISENQIKDLGITPATCVDWAKESFSIKNKAQLPAKISVHPQGNDFFTSMPCLLPQEFSRFGIKVVHRIVGGIPALGSDILLYDSNTGELLALLGGDWITAMRTGAVATLAIQTLKATDATTYSFIGLGNTARATMLCLLDSQKNTHHTVQLLKYKDQAGFLYREIRGLSQCYILDHRQYRESHIQLRCYYQLYNRRKQLDLSEK